MRHSGRAGPIIGNLPDLQEVGGRVRNDKVLLAEAGGADRVGRAAAVGSLDKEQLAGDSAGVGIECEGGDVARDADGLGAGGGEDVLGRGGVEGGEDDFISPVVCGVGDGCVAWC